MHKKNTRRTQRLCTRGSMVLSAILFTCAPAFAQYPLETQIYTHDGTYTDMDNVKNYSMEAIGKAKSVMAGTVWLTNVPWECGYTLPHFVQNNINALPVAGADVYYYNSNYHDQRVADIEVDDNVSGISYITVAMRAWEGGIATTYPFPTYCYVQENNPGPTDRDVFKVMCVNNADGTFNKQELIISELTGSGTSAWGLYPIHSLFNKNNNLLYVCGYVCKGDSYLMGQGEGYWSKRPVYHNDKYAFVFAIDVTSNPMTVVAKQYFDWTTSLPNTPDGWDFDMAMRMEMMGNGDLFVTGSASAQTGVNNNGHVRSGTMAMELNPNTLALIPGGNYSYIAQGNGDGFGINEYGIDFVENGSDLFVIGNTMDQNLADGEGENDQIGFQPKPSGIYVSYLNANYPNYFTPARMQYTGNKWALQTLQTKFPPGVVGGSFTDSRFIIAGQGSDNPSATYPGSIGNINPFLLDITLHVNNNTLTAPFLETTGTLKPSLILNYYASMFGNNNFGSYYNLGGGLSSIYWNPTFACRYDINEVIQMNAPVNDPTLYWNTLGLKVFHAKEFTYLGNDEISNQNTGTPDYPCSDVLKTQTPSAATNEAVPTPTPFIPNLLQTYPQNTIVRPMYAGGGGGCYQPAFKTTSTGKPILKQSVSNTVIAPNPATDEISVTLASDIAKDAKVQVVLHNMMGQVVGKLYEGSAAKLATASKLHLPAVASGMYTVQVISNGKTVHQQKLAIQ